jgi:hypothetical protein
VALWAAHKAGKSLLTLDAFAAAATGRSVLGEEEREHVSVLYLDMEMSETDVHERLRDMGYGPDDETALAKHFHYLLIPALPPLDTAAGGKLLLNVVEQCGTQAVCIDTTSRVISGRENDSDTFISLYRNTGQLLKRAGVGVLRLDHSGKDPSKGERGSSSKADDVDVSFGLTQRSDGKLVLAHHGVTRIPWIPDNIIIERQADPLRHVVVEGGSTAQADEVVRLLDKMGLDNNVSRREAIGYLRANGTSRRAEVVAEAVRFRKERVVPGSVPPLVDTGTIGATPVPGGSRNHD